MRGVRLEFEILAATLGIKPKSYRNGLEQCGFSRTIFADNECDRRMKFQPLQGTHSG